MYSPEIGEEAGELALPGWFCENHRNGDVWNPVFHAVWFILCGVLYTKTFPVRKKIIGIMRKFLFAI